VVLISGKGLSRFPPRWLTFERAEIRPPRLYAASLRRKLQPPEQVSVSRVRPYAVELRIKFKEKQVFRPYLICLLQPQKRPIFVSERRVNETDLNGIEVDLIRLLNQVGEESLRLLFSSRGSVSVTCQCRNKLRF